ncbi:MAG: hypothetical protein EBZ48_03355 [Proteobacteria bacterium]|nr:hypothetical protein [Pseudomonadota bacterium]
MAGHDNNQAIARDAYIWLIGAGTFAVALSLFLALADHGMSRSTSEQRLGETLRELRTAQASMHTRVTDPRQREDFLESQAVVDGADSASDSAHESAAATH